MAAKKKLDESGHMHLSAPTRKGTNILSIKVPKEMEKPVKTGINWFDVAAGGEEDPGLLPGTSTLLTGVPGGGKTTLALQLGESIMQSGNICLFNTGEQSSYAIRKATRRLKAENGFIFGSDRLQGNVIAHADWLKEQNPGKQIFLIQDSLQVLDDGFYGNGTVNSMTPVRVMQRFEEWIAKSFAVVIVIGQVTKSGQFAGKQAVKHHCDAHCHINFDMDKKSDTYGQRIFAYQKNRNGPINIEGTVLTMTAEGLQATGEVQDVELDGE